MAAPAARLRFRRCHQHSTILLPRTRRLIHVGGRCAGSRACTRARRCRRGPGPRAGGSRPDRDCHGSRRSRARIVTSSAPAMSPEDADTHRKAQRFARLLVDEIKLYNQAKVTEGRKNKDLYDRLKEDIDKSRATYKKRYGNTVAATPTISRRSWCAVSQKMTFRLWALTSGAEFSDRRRFGDQRRLAINRRIVSL